MNTPNRAQIKQQISESFGRAAKTYGRVVFNWWEVFAQQLVSAADVAQGARVLDVATGTGVNAFAAAKLEPSVTVTGIDLSQGMIDIAAKEAAARGLTNVTFKVMDAESLDFPDNSFDLITCGFGLMFLDIPKALAEWLRVLKPGGTVVVSTWGQDDQRWQWWGDIVKKHVPFMHQMAKARENQPPQIPTTTPEGMTQWLSDAGFVATRVTESEVDVSYADADEWLETQMSHGGRSYFEATPSPAREEMIDEAYKHLNAMRTASGIPHRFFALISMARKPS